MGDNVAVSLYESVKDNKQVCKTITGVLLLHSGLRINNHAIFTVIKPISASELQVSCMLFHSVRYNMAFCFYSNEASACVDIKITEG